MKSYQLRSINHDAVMFEGRFKSFKDCLEHAVLDRVALDCVNLRDKNLTNANLDDAIMPYADFRGSNLIGANMSEAYLKGSNFAGTALYNVCFNDSNMSACDFDNASFGATDIHGSIISQSQFSTLSCFSLDFNSVRQMGGCIFINPDGRICQMSRPPIVIRGMGRDPIILMDRQVKAGHNIIDHKRLSALAEKLTVRTLRRRLTA